MNTKNAQIVALVGNDNTWDDQLIVSRACRLVREVAGIDFETKTREKASPPSGASILLGGACLKEDLLPNVLPWRAGEVDKLGPMVPVGVGWNAYPGDSLSERNFEFSRGSMSILDKWIAEETPISVSDVASRRLLERFGLASQTTMTGSPAWYNLDTFADEIDTQRKVKRIAFTPAIEPSLGELSVLFGQLLHEAVPKAKPVSMFHAGIDRACEKSEARKQNSRMIANRLAECGYEIRDFSGGIEGDAQYENVDFHVGFCVNAHLYFLSGRKPSLLLSEDGRGTSVQETLGQPALHAPHRTIRSLLSRGFLQREVPQLIKSNHQMINDALRAVHNEIDNGYPHSRRAVSTMKRRWPMMERFLKDELPRALGFNS